MDQLNNSDIFWFYQARSFFTVKPLAMMLCRRLFKMILFLTISMISFILGAQQDLKVTKRLGTSESDHFSIEKAIIQGNGNSSLIKSTVAEMGSIPGRLWSTYYGGDDNEAAYGVKTDANGNVFVTGRTESTNNMTTIDAYQDTLSGGHDMFLVKFDVLGNRDWATYFGGPEDDIGNRVTVDMNGNVIVVGNTASESGIASSGAHQDTFAGGMTDAFIAKFDPTGDLLWSTYYGGNSDEHGLDVAVDDQGRITITGLTGSYSNIATPGSYQSTPGGSADAFVAQFDANGNRLWGTYYGGSNHDYAGGIATDPQNNLIICGFTESSNSISTSGAHQSQFGGVIDGFVAKFNSNGTLLWGSYYGGGAYDDALNVTADASGNIIIQGNTGSSTSIATPGSQQPSRGGGLYDVFVAKFDPAGNRLWGTYCGGTGHEYAHGVVTDQSRNIYITGRTQSPTGIATPGSYQPAIGLGNDAFIVSYDKNGNRNWGTYVGASYFDHSRTIACDKDGNLLIAGEIRSSQNFASAGAHQELYGGGFSDAFVAKFSPLETGVNLLPQQNSIYAYPNPTSEDLLVSGLQSQGSLSVINLEGIKLLEYPIHSSRVKLNTSDLPNGLYLLVWRIDGNLMGSIRFSMVK